MHCDKNICDNLLLEFKFSVWINNSSHKEWNLIDAIENVEDEGSIHNKLGRLYSEGTKPIFLLIVIQKMIEHVFRKLTL